MLQWLAYKSSKPLKSNNLVFGFDFAISRTTSISLTVYENLVHNHTDRSLQLDSNPQPLSS